MLDHHIVHKEQCVFCFHFLPSQAVLLGREALHDWRTWVFSESVTIPTLITTIGLQRLESLVPSEQSKTDMFEKGKWTVSKWDFIKGLVETTRTKPLLEN